MVNLKDLNKRLKRLEERVLPEIEEEKREKEQKDVEYMVDDIPIDEALKIKEILDEWKGCRWDKENLERVGKGKKRIHYGVPYGMMEFDRERKTVGFKDFNQFSDEDLKRKTLEIWKKLFNEKELRRLQDKLEDCETVSEVKSVLPPKLGSSLESKLKKYTAEVHKIVKNRSKKR
ncbi:MAG: hypothetical protein KKA79_03395 [Nanoarchaeota archaeon]|nr:hypothetical protein [Nanoarchaeota archaeon]